MENNKDLRTEYIDSFYVIVADRDGVRKYVSSKFPNLFSYTVKLNNTKRFYSEQQAETFIRGFREIENPEIRIVQKRLILI